MCVWMCVCVYGCVCICIYESVSVWVYVCARVGGIFVCGWGVCMCMN